MRHYPMMLVAALAGIASVAPLALRADEPVLQVPAAAAVPTEAEGPRAAENKAAENKAAEKEIAAPARAEPRQAVQRAVQGDPTVQQHAVVLIDQGQKIFRYDTFGSQDFWGGRLKLHSAIVGARQGGVGPGLSPRQALALGLKVDASALPKHMLRALKRNSVDLDDPATTVALLKMDAIVGLKGFFGNDGRLASVGVQCALCHSTVDDTVMGGIGERLDGWANRDVNVGAIMAAAPDLSPLSRLLAVDDATVRKILNSWGPGKFDAQLILDGKTVNPNTGRSSAVLIPPAFGLAGMNFHAWTGWGSVSHWNAFVSSLDPGKGALNDSRLNDAARFPVAARAGLGKAAFGPRQDVITPKLAPLQLYQMALPAPRPPEDNFDRAGAERGRALFQGKARCSSCHVPPLFTEPGWNLHTAEEIGIDDFQAARAPDGRYRTAPLKGLWTHTKGGFYHDGRFATLLDLLEHYNRHFSLGLNEQEKSELVEYLESL